MAGLVASSIITHWAKIPKRSRGVSVGQKRRGSTEATGKFGLVPGSRWRGGRHEICKREKGISDHYFAGIETQHTLRGGAFIIHYTVPKNRRK